MRRAAIHGAWVEWWITAGLVVAVCWIGAMLRDPVCTGTLQSVTSQPAPAPLHVAVVVTVAVDGERMEFLYFGEPWCRKWTAQRIGTALTWRPGILPSPPWPGDDR